MNFDPQKFFIGIVDLFSVLLPGAAVLFFLVWQSADAREFIQTDIGSGPHVWLLLFFASYLIGHFLFMIGSWLDDCVYDPLTEMSDANSIKRLSKGDHLASDFRRQAAWLLRIKTDDSALIQVHRLKALALAPAVDPLTINAFQWSKIRLSKHHPPGLAAVERFEADSKFFRSLTVPLAGLTLLLAGQCLGWQALGCLVLTVLAFARYVSQRRKAIRQALWLVLTLDEVSGKEDQRPERGAGEPTHAGGVVYKSDENRAVQYLVIQAEQDRDQWVLPKGHIERGEHPREAAVREVREETGYWARIVAPMKIYALGSGVTAPQTQFYLMEREAVPRQEPAWDSRKEKWVSAADIDREVSFEESRKVIRDADALRLKIASKQQSG